MKRFALLLICIALGFPAFISAAEIKTYQPEVIAEYPHNPNHFTQGLFFHNDKLYESTGLYKQSALYAKNPVTGQTVSSWKMADIYFGEGAVQAWGKIYLLTWRENTGFILTPDTLELIDDFRYEGEGWGLTFNGQKLIRSDGSSSLFFHDERGALIGLPLKVTKNGYPLENLNELEWIPGTNLVLANIWQSREVAAINLNSGQVEFSLDLSSLQAPANPHAVANGLAFEPEEQTLWLTGKLWPKIYKIKWPPQN